MNPRLELLKLISGQTTTSGIVVSLKNTIALVSTNRGTMSCSILTQTNLAIGDTVSIRNGNVISKLTPDDSPLIQALQRYTDRLAG